MANGEMSGRFSAPGPAAGLPLISPLRAPPFTFTPSGFIGRNCADKQMHVAKAARVTALISRSGQLSAAIALLDCKIKEREPYSSFQYQSRCKLYLAERSLFIGHNGIVKVFRVLGRSHFLFLLEKADGF